MLAEKEAKEAALLKPHLTRLMANTALNGYFLNKKSNNLCHLNNICYFFIYVI